MKIPLERLGCKGIGVVLGFQILSALCASFANFAVRFFNRRGRQEGAKNAEEKKKTRAYESGSGLNNEQLFATSSSAERAL